MDGDCRWCGELRHRGLCLPEATHLLAEANERIRELEQKSPNVWNIGDSAYAELWDSYTQTFAVVPVKIHSLPSDGWIQVERNGSRYLRPARVVRRTK